MSQQEIIGFLSVSLLASIVSYIITRVSKHSFWWPMLLWSISIISWFIYNRANSESALWFTDFDGVGTYIGFFGVVMLGMYYALQTILMFELGVEYCDREDSTYILIPICALVIGVLRIFTHLGYLSISISWLFIPICILVVIGIYKQWDDGDGDEIIGSMGILLIMAVIAAYIYTFALIIETSAWLFSLIFFVLLFRKSEAKDFIMDLGPKVKCKTNDTTTTIRQIHNSTNTSTQKDFSTKMIVTFKGKYYLNGTKQINRKIRCSMEESRKYTSYMYDRNIQKEWILKNYPGAELDKGWSLNVNITKE